MTRNTILVVAAHPDDEALGCGGTLIKHKAQGDDVYTMFLTDGVSSRERSSQESAEKRREASKNAGAILGVTSSFHFNFPDNGMDGVTIREVAGAIEDTIKEVTPNVVYTHHFGDLNVDHRVAYEATMVACRPQPGIPIRLIYGFEVVSSTGWSAPEFAPFLPNVFVDVSDVLDRKIEALECYRAEIREEPHARSYEHVRFLAKHRGCTVGLQAAEAFTLYRSISSAI